MNQNDDELRKRLTPLQYRVTQQKGTEPPFQNEYWDEKREGVYLDIVSGEPLFLSVHKFDSGTGWPSFTKPIHNDAVTEHSDSSAGMKRVEVCGAISHAHLGHVFPDGPSDSETGLRYCMNSAALRFVPINELEKEHLEHVIPLFKKH
jgi:methionine-R-sulfoxide reductase